MKLSLDRERVVDVIAYPYRFTRILLTLQRDEKRRSGRMDAARIHTGFGVTLQRRAKRLNSRRSRFELKAPK